MRLLVTGSRGMPARRRVRGHDRVAPCRRGRDCGRASATSSSPTPSLYGSVVASLGRDGVVVNAAAWTDVDGAETQEEAAFAINATAPAVLAAACAGSRAPLAARVDRLRVRRRPSEGRPYAPADAPRPTTAYGRTKLAGERAVGRCTPTAAHVVRTAWVYGQGRTSPATMARLAAVRETVEVVDDQHGSPTWARDLASGLLALAVLRPPGDTWHLTGAGHTSWFGFAREVFRLTGHDPDRVRPTTTAAFASPTPRPAWSVLDGTGWLEAGLPEPRAWQVSLAEAVRTGNVVDPR